MAHRTLGTLVFAGMEPTTAATVLSLLGDEGLPAEIRIVEALSQEPWHQSRSGLLVVGMTPETDLARVSQLIQNRTTWWEVVVCLSDVLIAYEVALLAQGAAKVIRHPMEDLEGTANQLRALLKSMNFVHTDAFGLELSDLIQLFGEKRLDKTIRLTGGGTIGSIFMRGGNVVHSETMDDLIGMDAFRALLKAAPSAEMRVHKGCLSSKVTLNMPAMSALLEGSRILDEDAATSGEHARPPQRDDKHDSMDGIGLFDSIDEVAKPQHDSLFDELDMDHSHGTPSRPATPPPSTRPKGRVERT